MLLFGNTLFWSSTPFPLYPPTAHIVASPSFFLEQWNVAVPHTLPHRLLPLQTLRLHGYANRGPAPFFCGIPSILYLCGPPLFRDRIRAGTWSGRGTTLALGQWGRKANRKTACEPEGNLQQRSSPSRAAGTFNQKTEIVVSVRPHPVAGHTRRSRMLQHTVPAVPVLLRTT
ncbi:MAG: hypothetical protein KatS3mg110_0648 [Pirellulaceae bacterium]|nr:MAG: hypothetical protein KatS3mg110_0648 [Pirellulaceae bacterium]